LSNLTDPYIAAVDLYEKTYRSSNGHDLALAEIKKKEETAYNKEFKEWLDEVHRWINKFYHHPTLWPVYRPSKKVIA